MSREKYKQLRAYVYGAMNFVGENATIYTQRGLRSLYARCLETQLWVETQQDLQHIRSLSASFWILFVEEVLNPNSSAHGEECSQASDVRDIISEGRSKVGIVFVLLAVVFIVDSAIVASFIQIRLLR